jgi:hypothetical protein
MAGQGVIQAAFRDCVILTALTQERKTVEIRLDRVTRKRFLGFNALYTLILNESGLYLIYTGDARTLRFLTSESLDHPLVRSLQANEAALTEASLSDLARQPDNLYLPLPEIHAMKLKEDEEGRPIELRLYTSEGDFTFTFPLNPTAQVRALVSALIERSVDDQTNEHHSSRV